MNSHLEPRICAIVVCFEPELSVLKQVIESLSSQVETTVIIDNGSDATVRSWLMTKQARCLVHLPQQENLGVAAAHNLGIEWAQAHGHTHVMAMDQDSLATPGMVARLLLTLRTLEEAGERVAAVGPTLYDTNTRSVFPFIRLGILSNRCYPDPKQPSIPIQADIIISSGKLIPLTVIENIGGMDKDLFIDNVDVEWCFRAAGRRYKLFGDPCAIMQHSLGDRVHRTWFIRTRLVIVHKPIRLYYMMRNRLQLYRRSYTPWLWMVQDWHRLILKLILFSILIPPRRTNIRMMLSGLSDGVRGKVGRYHAQHESEAFLPPAGDQLKGPVVKTVNRG